LTLQELTRLAERNPTALIKEFFLDTRGILDCIETSGVLAISDMDSASHRNHLHQAAWGYSGLHHVLGNHRGSTTIYLGWGGNPVNAAAKNNAAPGSSTIRKKLLARPVAISQASRAVRDITPEIMDNGPTSEDVAEQHNENLQHPIRLLVRRFIVNNSDGSGFEG
jgi:hypothetical protein